MRERILITGPGGRVGTQIVPLLREHFALRLLDVKPLPATNDDEVLQADIRDFDALRSACTGVKALVHLAAIPDEDEFYTRLAPMNLVGAYNAFEAARQAGLGKVIFASTGQTVVNYGRSHWVTTGMPVRPCTVYACTKVFGESLARYYSDIHGVPVICIRICYFRAYDDPILHIPDHEVQRTWCSPRDLTQLIVKSIQSDLRFAIFFGISNNTQRVWDLSNAQQLVGYQPQDNAANYVSKPSPST
jgi:uronate dehydrogenase